MIELDNAKVDRLKTYVDNNFKLSDLFTELKIRRSEKGKIYCPFHPENNPSFTVDFEMNKFHCFSCAKGGGYLNFLYFYRKYAVSGLDIRTNTKGNGLTYNQFLQDFLRENPRVQEALKISSLKKMTRDYINLDDTFLLKLEKHEPRKVDLSLNPFIMEKSITDIGELLQFFGKIQRGTLLEDIIFETPASARKNGEVKRDIEKTNLFVDDILSDDEE